MRALLIEDDEDKLHVLTVFLQKEYSTIQISTARSFASGLRECIRLVGKIDFILMDMSMPNYDVTPKEPTGGNPEPFAGRELLAQMKLRSISTPVIIVTMFDFFLDKNEKILLPQLVSELKDKYSPPYADTVYYDSRKEGWQSALTEIINKIRVIK